MKSLKHRYKLSNMKAHTAQIRATAEGITRRAGVRLSEAFDAFSAFAEAIERQPPSLERNVRYLIACRFINHVYSSLLLAEAGLLADAAIAERTALEVLAAYRLVCISPEYAKKFEAGEFPRPVEVRKALAAMGHAEEADQIRTMYSSGSELTHVTRANERFNARWDETNSAKLFIGGHFNRADHLHQIEFLALMIQWFLGIPAKEYTEGNKK